MLFVSIVGCYYDIGAHSVWNDGERGIYDVRYEYGAKGLGDTTLLTTL